MTNLGVKYDAAANYQRMAATIRRQRALLERLEWNRDGRCNGCEGFQWTDGHVNGCEVAAELGRPQG
jgi:hypothetical protein